MKYNVSILNPSYNFDVEGVSYAGNPKDSTVMFITSKVADLLDNLQGHRNCLIFVQNSINISDELKKDNLFVFTENPQREYAKFITCFAEEKENRDRSRKYTLTPLGYYLGENVRIGENVYIEPGVFIGHDVVIGNDSKIFANAVIKNAIIGNNAIINEYAMVGASGFTMAEDELGVKFRLPTLGKVIIGNHVEIGVHDNISCGSGGDTVIEDNVKLDTMVHVAHDVYLEKNTEITAGAIIGGFVHIGENGYMGINSSIRNRRSIGSNSLIGMGAVVLKPVDDNTVVVGNPARVLRRNN